MFPLMNAMRRQDSLSYPSRKTKKDAKFNLDIAEILDQATTGHAREFLEA